jgi:hypothetical protein
MKTELRVCPVGFLFALYWQSALIRVQETESQFFLNILHYGGHPK